MKKTVYIIPLLVAAVFLTAAAAVLAGDANGDGKIDNKDVKTLFGYVSGNTSGAVSENCDYNGDGKVNNKDVTNLFRDISAGNVPEPTDEGWLTTIQSANALKNGVQGKFTDASRNGFVISNKNALIVYNLKSGKKVEGIYNVYGTPYFTDNDTYVTNSAGTYSAAGSSESARMNSNRIGYYYYDFHFRDQNFGSLKSLNLDHTFHTYSDKLHEEVRVVASDNYTGGGSLETKYVIPSSCVNSVIFKNAAGEKTKTVGFDFTTAEFVAFDIKDAGIFGIIMPAAENNGYIKVKLNNNVYEIIRGIDLPDIPSGGDIRFGHRIYTSTDHGFDGIRKEAYIERNPLTDISVSRFDNAEYEGYDAIRGCYRFTVLAVEFDEAMYRQPDRHFRVKARIGGDGEYDRTIYIQTAENKSTTRGRLECAALLDEDGRMVPVPLEVGKNFDGDAEEQLYAPETGNFSMAYGEVYAPLTVAKNENKRFTMLHLYQNWGNYPLKQLSFIAFHIPYYHLSVGVTETNCITPYYVYGKDGWMLPDCRANSAELWDNGAGTQHTCAGRLFFLQYKDSGGSSYMTESQSANIVSAGPVYADIIMEHLSDDGKIKATYRHTEMAQTDETRTFYNIRLEVLEDITINKFRDNFSFFKVDSRGFVYSRIGYLDAGNQPQIASCTSSGLFSSTKYYTLGQNCPYFDYFKGRNKNPSSDPNNGEYDTVNFGVIVKSSDITIGGQKYNGNFVFVDKYSYSLFSSPYKELNTGTLTLDLDGTVTLKKGDVMELQLIILPWGDYSSENDGNVRNVRADSCINPFKLQVIYGKPYDNGVIPSVRAKNNKATFKISGGKSTAAVRVYGFSSYTPPKVTFKADGVETDIRLCSKNHTYDGYQVYLDEDGTYSFAFNVNMDNAKEYEITVVQ